MPARVSRSPAGGAAEQLAERRRDSAVVLGAASRSEEELQVPEQQDARLHGAGPLEHRRQLHLGGCRSVSTHAHTVHLHAGNTGNVITGV